MDWIERLFHVAPDAGNGSLEIGIVAGAAIALAMVVVSAIKLAPWLRGRLAAPKSQPRDAHAGR